MLINNTNVDLFIFVNFGPLWTLRAPFTKNDNFLVCFVHDKRFKDENVLHFHLKIRARSGKAKNPQLPGSTKRLRGYPKNFVHGQFLDTENTLFPLSASKTALFNPFPVPPAPQNPDIRALWAIFDQTRPKNPTHLEKKIRPPSYWPFSPFSRPPSSPPPRFSASADFSGPEYPYPNSKFPKLRNFRFCPFSTFRGQKLQKIEF